MAEVGKKSFFRHMLKSMRARGDIHIPERILQKPKKNKIINITIEFLDEDRLSF